MFKYVFPLFSIFFGTNVYAQDLKFSCDFKPGYFSDYVQLSANVDSYKQPPLGVPPEPGHRDYLKNAVVKWRSSGEVAASSGSFLHPFFNDRTGMGRDLEALWVMVGEAYTRGGAKINIYIGMDARWRTSRIGTRFGAVYRTSENHTAGYGSCQFLLSTYN